MQFNQLTDEQVRNGIGKIRVRGHTGNLGTLDAIKESDDFTVFIRWDDPTVPESCGYKDHMTNEVIE